MTSKSNYLDFILRQEKEFVKLVHGTSAPQKNFKDNCFCELSIDELQKLDEKFINMSETRQSLGVISNDRRATSSK